MSAVSAGEVVATFVKRRKGSAVVPAAQLDCAPGSGIVDDANADAGSPRQVLLVAGEVERRLGLAPGALWENITTSGIDVDTLSSGTQLRIGETAVLGLTYPCRPCTVITAATGVAARRLTGQRGVLAVVVSGGTVSAGDPVRVLDAHFEPLPESYLDRCRLVVAQVPAGAVVTYDEVVTAIGAPAAVHRLLPAWLSRLGAQGLAAHRVIASPQGPLGAEQSRRLVAEGVAVGDQGVFTHGHGHRLGPTLTPWPTDRCCTWSSPAGAAPAST
ncbi:MAG: MOSC domain-containing protein [Acidimicrobiales bacterium]